MQPDITTEEAAAYQRMALVLLTKSLETLTEKMAANQIPALDKRGNDKEVQTQVRRGTLRDIQNKTGWFKESVHFF